jgi:hypothetical protein
VVTNAVATSVATFSKAGPIPPARNLRSLGLSWSGWRDLNSRPLDPQTSAARPRTSAVVRISL